MLHPEEQIHSAVALLRRAAEQVTPGGPRGLILQALGRIDDFLVGQEGYTVVFAFSGAPSHVGCATTARTPEAAASTVAAKLDSRQRAAIQDVVVIPGQVSDLLAPARGVQLADALAGRGGVAA